MITTQVYVLVLGAVLVAPAFAQSSSPAGTAGDSAQPATATSGPAAQNASKDASDNSTYATGKPLAGQSKEGFWGKVNPFARKKWVNRQVDPIKDRTNELDQLQAKNANDIRDVDSRSQAGIGRAMTAANSADQRAAAARNAANAAANVATDASKRTSSLNGTVSNLDQYQTVSALPVVFPRGRTSLGPKAKTELDDIASKLANEKGYIIEVQGYSPSGVQTSQAMADSVVRYLVTQHQVPIYRIYKTGLGKAQQSSQEAKTLTNGVMVSLLHNSLATMDSNNASAAAVKPATSSSTTGVSTPNEN